MLSLLAYSSSMKIEISVIQAELICIYIHTYRLLPVREGPLDGDETNSY